MSEDLESGRGYETRIASKRTKTIITPQIFNPLIGFSAQGYFFQNQLKKITSGTTISTIAIIPNSPIFTLFAFFRCIVYPPVFPGYLSPRGTETERNEAI